MSAVSKLREEILQSQKQIASAKRAQEALLSESEDIQRKINDYD